MASSCSMLFGFPEIRHACTCADKAVYLMCASRQTSRSTVTSNVPALNSARFLTVFETATILRVSKQTVYRLVRAGDLEAIRVGRSFRIPEQVVKRRTSVVSRLA
jgi:excisionase family DNA binding protein